MIKGMASGAGLEAFVANMTGGESSITFPNGADCIAGGHANDRSKYQNDILRGDFSAVQQSI